MYKEIEFLRSNEINDIWRYIKPNGEEDFIEFPRTMEYKKENVESWLNEFLNL